MASAHRQVGQREAAELGTQLGAPGTLRVLYSAESMSNPPLLELPRGSARPGLPQVGTEQQSWLWAQPGVCFLHRCSHCPCLLLLMQYCASATHFIARESWFFTEGIFLWLSSDLQGILASKLSLVLTWSNLLLALISGLCDSAVAHGKY